MAALAALVLLLGAMFGGALAVDGWRARRLRAWAEAHGLSAVDRKADGGALLAHANRFSRRVRLFGLSFHQATPADELWVAEHRANVTTRPAEKWYTLVVVRIPGAALPAVAAGPESATALDQVHPGLATWPHGGDIALDGEFVRWRRPGLLWPWSVEATIAHGRELVTLVTGAGH